MNAPRNELDERISAMLQREGPMFCREITTRLSLQRRDRNRVAGTLRRLFAKGLLSDEFRKLASGSGRPRRYFSWKGGANG